MTRSLRVVACALVLVAVSGCASTNTGGASSSAGPAPSGTPTPTGRIEAIGPIMIVPAEVEGTTLDVPMSRLAVVASGDVPVTDWNVTVADPAILAFTPGTVKDGMSSNPALWPKQAGSTSVKLTGGGKTYTFTITVTD